VSLPAFLHSLLKTGHVQVSQPEQDEPLSGTLDTDKLLSDFEQSWRLDFPGEAPSFHGPSAGWAAKMLYRAAQAAVFRDISEPVLRDRLGVACPQVGDGTGRHYSVDLVFRFLPDLAALARHNSPEDPLLRVLQSWANQWPLSSVGMKGVETVDMGAIAGHRGLLQLYADRILAREDFSRLSDPRVQAAVRESVGAYAELSPALANYLQKHE